MTEEIHHENIDYTLFENIKMKMLGMINSAASPYDIIYEIAKELEAVTHDAEGDFTEEEKTRIEFAIVLHKKNIERLKGLIQHAEAFHEEPYIDKL